MNIDRLAQANQFGRLVKQYRPQTLTFLIAAAICAIFGAALVMFTGVGIPIGGGWVIHGGIWFLALGLFFVIGTAFFCFQAIVTIGMRLFLFEQGLIYTNFGVNKVIPYNAIVTLWQGRLPRDEQDTQAAREKVYRITTKTGTELKLTDVFDNIEDVGDRLHQAMVQYHLALALSQFVRGQDLPFGPFTLNRDGLSTPIGTLPLSELGNVRLEQGILFFESTTGQPLEWLSTWVAAVPNPYLFIALIQQIVDSDSSANGDAPTLLVEPMN